MPRVEAEFTESQGGVVADVVLAWPGGKPTTRRVVARSCSQAADAVALIIAVGFDPESAVSADSSTRMNDATRAPSSAPTEPATHDDKRPSPRSQAPTDERPPDEPAPDEPAPDEPAPDVLRADEARIRIAAQAAAQTVFGPAPGVLPGVSLYGFAELERDSLWSPALLLGVTRVWRSGFEEPGGDASFVLEAATLDLCPLKLDASRAYARICGSALLGRLSVEGSNTQNPAGALGRPFAVAGGTALLALRLGSRFDLAARLGLGATLVRDSFEFTPVVFHTVAPVTVLASVGIGFGAP